jgi:hypothetical protein
MLTELLSQRGQGCGAREPGWRWRRGPSHLPVGDVALAVDAVGVDGEQRADAVAGAPGDLGGCGPGAALWGAEVLELGPGWAARSTKGAASVDGAADGP